MAADSPPPPPHGFGVSPDGCGYFRQTSAGTPPTIGSGTKTVLEPILGSAGYFCSKAARPVLTDYGFEPTAACG